MITKLSRMDSSSSSLKYSVRTYGKVSSEWQSWHVMDLQSKVGGGRRLLRQHCYSSLRVPILKHQCISPTAF